MKLEADILAVLLKQPQTGKYSDVLQWMNGYTNFGTFTPQNATQLYL